ncbi:hypothetical protein X805_15130 [Sphaerotilus natans subsp. natans DSM 6575]|uniref:Uncharacterized protein n=1 Tax=Sphaerotilus natans subsp. natans DSM 6575 TaxID=1286631 RepID=A0A059KNV1_9BURK|nr:hypothetical protein X805_15130 [Sphaerotilus natans subsp. natans DSM 6575]
MASLWAGPSTIATRRPVHELSGTVLTPASARLSRKNRSVLSSISQTISSSMRRFSASVSQTSCTDF